MKLSEFSRVFETLRIQGNDGVLYVSREQGLTFRIKSKDGREAEVSFRTVPQIENGKKDLTEYLNNSDGGEVVGARCRE